MALPNGQPQQVTVPAEAVTVPVVTAMVPVAMAAALPVALVVAAVALHTEDLEDLAAAHREVTQDAPTQTLSVQATSMGFLNVLKPKSR